METNGKELIKLPFSIIKLDTILKKIEQAPALISHTVTFVANGIAISTQTIEDSEDAIAPVNPTRVEWTFEGWEGSYTNITSSRTITAVWSKAETVITGGYWTVIPCSTCDGLGYYDGQICHICGGDGCDTCNYMGFEPCYTCDKTGFINDTWVPESSEYQIVYSTY